MQNENLRKSIPVISAIIVLTVVGIYIYRDTQASRVPEEAVSEREATTTPSVTENPEEGKDYTVELLPPETTTVQEPNLSRPIVFGSTVDAEVRTIISSNVTKIVSDLKTDGERVDLWMSLGMQYKIAGDYEGARMVWEYVGSRAPSDPVSFYNLGDLYANYLKNSALAEKNFKIAIKNNPKNVGSYRALHELYRYNYPANKDLADDILIEGLKVNPSAVDLMVVIAAYYKDTGNLVGARGYYDQAIVEAEKQGNTTLASLLKQDRASLQ